MLLASLNLAVSINNKNINERIIVIFISLTLMATRTEMREPFMDLHEQSTALNLSLASLVHTHSDRTECSSWFCEDLASVCKCITYSWMRSGSWQCPSHARAFSSCMPASHWSACPNACAAQYLKLMHVHVARAQSLVLTLCTLPGEDRL